jgi:hypothetical protein
MPDTDYKSDYIDFLIRLRNATANDLETVESYQARVASLDGVDREMAALDRAETLRKAVEDFRAIDHALIATVAEQRLEARMAAATEPDARPELPPERPKRARAHFIRQR